MYVIFPFVILIGLKIIKQKHVFFHFVFAQSNMTGSYIFVLVTFQWSFIVCMYIFAQGKKKLELYIVIDGDSGLLVKNVNICINAFLLRRQAAKGQHPDDIVHSCAVIQTSVTIFVIMIIALSSSMKQISVSTQHLQ